MGSFPFSFIDMGTSPTVAKMLPQLVSRGSGSVDTVTISRNKSGTYFKKRAGSTATKTDAQVAQQSLMTEVRSMWSGLTVEQRRGWSQWGSTVHTTGATGRPKTSNGQTAFVASNMLRGLGGLSFILDAPTIPSLAPWPHVIQATVDGFGNITLEFYAVDAPTSPDTGDAMILSMSAAMGRGARALPSKLRFGGLIDCYLSETVVITAPSVPAQYVASYPNQQYLQLRRILPDGRYSQPVFFGPMDAPAPPVDVGWYIDPWEIVIDLTGQGANQASLATVSAIVDPGAGYAGLAFSLQGDGKTILATTTGAAPGVYNTTLHVTTSLGLALLTTQITIAANPYGLTYTPWNPTVSLGSPDFDPFTNGSLFYVDYINVVFPYGVFFHGGSGGTAIEAERNHQPAGVFQFYLMVVGSLGIYMMPSTATAL